MARTSKRYDKKVVQEERKVFRAGIYVRISNERHESWREKSSSPMTQAITCKDYAKSENIEVAEVYEDYEYSGTNFQRPAYIQMMEDVKNRKINCIIVRDLSRLGREHIEMGRLIDKVFPFLGVRFISVSDNLDTEKGVNNNKSFEVMLKNIINDMYAKDMSAKIISVKQQRAKDGYFIGSVPPYGYKIDKTPQGQKLIIDENTAPIVRMIFDMTLAGKSSYEVAKELNCLNISTGMHYFKTGEVHNTDINKQWHKSTISKMLMNRTYTGDLVQGKKCQNLGKNEKQRLTKEDEWIIAENAHEAIVTREEFERMLQGRKERKANHKFASKAHDFKRDYVNRYQGKIFAYDSNEPMYRRTRIYGKNRDRLLYTFQTENFSGKINYGVKLFIHERDLDEIVQSLILDLANKMINEKEFLNRTTLRFEQQYKILEQKKTTCNMQVERFEILGDKLYEKFALSEIDRETYSIKKEEYSSQKAAYIDEFARIDKSVKELKLNEKRAKSWIKNIFKARKKVKLDKELIDLLIERIDVKANKELDIKLTFSLDSLEGLNE